MKGNTQHVREGGVPRSKAAAKVPALLLLIAMVILVGGVACTTTPKETVELSYTVGRDLAEVHRTYQLLIRTHFDSLRERVNTFVDRQWKPIFLRKFIKKGELVESAQLPDPNQVLERVDLWATLAIDRIEQKRQELLKPIDDQESELRESVDDAFTRLALANATITAYLNSKRQVEEVQAKVLEAFNLEGLRKQINDGLVKASELAQQGIDATAKAEGIVLKARDVKTQIESTFGGTGDE